MSSFCDKVTHELDQAFCKPTARCFKGISILTALYSLVCLLICAIVGPLIKVHDGNTIDSPDAPPTAETIAQRIVILTKSTLYIALGMFVISLISLYLFLRFRKIEAKKVAARQ